jgi:predicted AlkP superfamily phosphohydrolase/phosphomutase
VIEWRLPRHRWWLPLLALGLIVLLILTVQQQRRLHPPIGARASQRTVVMGFDGMDPVLLQRWMDDGSLPNFAALRRDGHFQTLATTEPAQSPVAWSSFATGLNPGAHGIFDFLRRDPKHYLPEFSIAENQPPETLQMLGMSVPLGSGALSNLRQGVPFWLRAEQRGQRAGILRVPVTFPPDPVQMMISGMGVPDLLGSQGSYTLIANQVVAQAANGGRVVMQAAGADCNIDSAIPGPAHPLYPAQALSLPIRILRQAEADRVQIVIDGNVLSLSVGQWSDWQPIHYRFLGFGRIPGMLRLYLESGFPKLRLYVSPVQVDPLNPAFTISAPASAAAALATRIGRYHTLGMPEETWAFNQGHLDEQAWLDSVKTTLAEGEAMLHDRLDRGDSELVVAVFVQPDRVSHMFWRGLDETHPLHAQASPLARGAIHWIYQESDRILGEVRRKLGPQDRLIVLSDHGFTSFRRAAHLNRWLVQNGYLTLKAGASESASLFADVDWSRSRAYALGLNSLFLNRRGREAQGVVAAAAVPALKQQISAGLLQWQDRDGSNVIAAMHDAAAIYFGAAQAAAPDLVVGYAAGYRASWQTTLGAVPAALVEDNRQNWSGDHCVDSALVPGILLTSFQPTTAVNNIADVAELVMTARPASGPTR